MTKREALDRMLAHFSAPGAQLGLGTEPGGTATACIYRADGDASSTVRCSVGVLIPDEIYSPSMEGMDATGLAREFPILRDVLGLPFSWLTRVQNHHDKLARHERPVEEFCNWLLNEIERVHDEEHADDDDH